MGYSPIRRQFGSEAQCGEHLVAVIVLYDLPHGFECHGVGVELIGIHVMEGSGLGWVAWEPYERKCVLLVQLNHLTGTVFLLNCQPHLKNILYIFMATLLNSIIHYNS